MYKSLAATLIVGLALTVLIASVVQHRDLFRSLAGGPSASAGFGGAGGQRGGDEAFLDQFDTSNLQVPREELLRGGPPKDGIPALTDPQMAPVDEADFLEPDDRVVGVTIGGQSRAYPIRLLNWHEVVNDELDGVPFAVVYCPLCDSASVFDRRVDGQTLEFGVSGLLYNSNVLMYDRTDDALWSQILFKAVSGPHAGEPLTHLPWDLTRFAQWKEAHPDSEVATFNTGHRRAYGRNPYEQYFQQEGLMFPAKGGEDDDRLPQKEPVVGILVNGTARAYPVQRVADAPGGELVDELDGHRIVLAAPEGGEVRVKEQPAEAMIVHTFWFAWAAFHPETDVYE